MVGDVGDDNNEGDKDEFLEDIDDDEMVDNKEEVNRDDDDCDDETSEPGLLFEEFFELMILLEMYGLTIDVVAESGEVSKVEGKGASF